MKNGIAIGFLIGMALALGVNTMMWRSPGWAIIEYCESLLDEAAHEERG